MRALSGELLLAAWERGTSEHDLNRALTMLALALPDSSRSQLAEMSFAERNLELLRLRELSFGPVLRGFSVCSQCGARLEFALPVSSMRASAESQLPKGPAEWSEIGRRYRLRPVNTNDLLASLELADLKEAQDFVLQRCLNPAEESSDAIEKFEELHAAAEFNCAIECPECSGSDTLDLDIARFLWQEVCHAARRLLSEIHELASAYGWGEQSVARMSPQRRRAYLEMLSA